MPACTCLTSVSAGQRHFRPDERQSEGRTALGGSAMGEPSCPNNRFRRYQRTQPGNGRRWGHVGKPIRTCSSTLKMNADSLEFDGIAVRRQCARAARCGWNAPTTPCVHGSPTACGVALQKRSASECTCALRCRKSPASAVRELVLQRKKSHRRSCRSSWGSCPSQPATPYIREEPTPSKGAGSSRMSERVRR